MSYIQINNLTKSYKTGDISTIALNGVNLSIEKGEFTVIVGSSGAGKTTLLNLIGGMDYCTSGTILVDNKNITNFNSKELTKYRREDVGFVFQFYNLIPNITTLENVEMSTEIALEPFNATKILKEVGLDDKLDNFPAQLSGGQQQRVAIARAIAKKPKLLLCDEPTGALDYESGKAILKLLQNLSKDYNTTVVMITHNQALEAIGNHVVRFKNGAIYKEYYNSSPKDIDEVEW